MKNRIESARTKSLPSRKKHKLNTNRYADEVRKEQGKKDLIDDDNIGVGDSRGDKKDEDNLYKDSSLAVKKTSRSPSSPRRKPKNPYEHNIFS